MTTQQLDLWKGKFGDQYQDRNLLDDKEITARRPFWENIFKTIYINCNDYPKSVLEVGAGQGPNLAALEQLSMSIQKPIDLYATEINTKASIFLKENVKNVILLDDIPKDSIADLVFTYGVLIHTHPAHLLALQTKIYNASKRWIICAEYFAPESRSLPYRGEQHALWLDDYGSKWLDNFNLRVIGYGFCWKKTTKLDNITFWIFEKVEKMQ